MLDSELEELASPTVPDADGAAGRFQANVFTPSAPGVENISFESLLPQRGPNQRRSVHPRPAGRMIRGAKQFGT